MQKRVCLFLAMILCLSFLFISCKENVKTVTLTFDCAGGKEIDPITIISGQQVFLPSTTKNSYYLAGWYTESPSDFFENGIVINSNTTFHASWLANPQLTLEFTTTGTACASQTIVYGKQYTLPVSTKNNELFLGWYTDSACTISFLDSGVLKSKEPLTVILYAKWEDSLFYYEFTEEDGIPVRATIRGLLNQNDINNVVIKAYNTLPTDIQPSAFNNNEHLKGTLKLSEGIQKIGDFAFYNCKELVGSLVFPSSITDIGDSSFDSCIGFTGDLIIPENIDVIRDSAFCNCSGFDGALTLSSKTIKIKKNAFLNTGFTGNLTLPDGFILTEGYCFGNCTGFNGILTIPKSITDINSSSFAHCSNFNSTRFLQNSELPE